ncbi:aminotransferase class V-fold PLP-dependent enzyme [Nemorincola caseinilytica]
MDKRTFLRNVSLAGLGSIAALTPLSRLAAAMPPQLPKDGSKEAFWAAVRNGYKLTPEFINLENGFYCIMPQEILAKYESHIREVNMEGAHYMRTVQATNKKAAAAKLAQLAGCAADELIITRNTTESLDMIISGMDWKEGDEAVMAHQDYGAMLDMFKQVARRHGVVNKLVSVPQDPESDEEIVRLYANAITPRTRLLMVSHMINITGQILPIRKICDMAHSRGVQVMVDGAHALAHIQFAIRDLHCDYYGASLHKWLSVPLGAGMLYVRKDHIGRIWPLFAEEGREKNDILRLNHTGTHPPATDLTIADAMNYYHSIGAHRKEERLRYLRNYWVNKVLDLPGLVLNSPRNPMRSCAIANVGVTGMRPADLATTLLQRYKIYTVAIDNKAAGVHGVRITPNIYTSTAELDELVRALRELAA